MGDFAHILERKKIMFCPKCSAYLTEKILIKTEVKYAPGNVPIEYQATCPNCRVEMGKVSWGQLTVDPELEKELAKAPPAQDKGTDDAAVPASVPAAAPQKTCPHCGKPLPEDI